MATHRQRRKTVSSSGRVFSQEIQRGKKKNTRRITMRKEGRDRERERKKEAIKQPRSRPFAAPYIAIKYFRRRYEERETGDLYDENLYKSK